MERFSVRNGYTLFENIKSCQLSTRKRIWQVFARNVFLMDHKTETKYDIVEEILSFFGQSYDYNNHFQDHINNCKNLEKYISQEAEWYKVYDFVEYHINHGGKENLTAQYNEILEDEQTGYRIVDGYVVPITNEYEIKQIEDALQNSPEHVAQSLNLSLKHFSERENPDYNNAIKEAITAVEALCCTIVEGEENTLGSAIRKFEDYGIKLNDYLSNGIQALYKYTCNEDGKRHGGTTYIKSDIEDAKFMIVTCSAIVNYLLVKWDKAKKNVEENL